jgi:NAD(P)H-flavin reductase
LGTNYLFKEVGIGSELIFRGPQGVFVLPPAIDKDLYFVCTGTGIAPFRSMVHHIRDHNIDHRNIYLIFGTRSSRDLLYYSELKELESDVRSFRFLPTLSRETWDGCCGYVHAVYENLVAENAVNGTLPPSNFFLCGWKNMVDEAKARILQMGFDKRDIHLELYG